jgi:hypothetical protein
LKQGIVDVILLTKLLVSKQVIAVVTYLHNESHRSLEQSVHVLQRLQALHSCIQVPCRRLVKCRVRRRLETKNKANEFMKTGATRARTVSPTCGSCNPNRKHDRNTCGDTCIQNKQQELGKTAGASTFGNRQRSELKPAVILPLPESKNHLTIQTLVRSGIGYPSQCHAFAQARAIFLLGL